MFVFNKTTTLLILLNFLSYGLVDAQTKSDIQSTDYQKEADKYKMLYEKYQKLADKTSKEKALEKTKNESSKKPEEQILKKPEEPKKEIEISKKDIPSEKDLKKAKAVTEPWKGTDFGLGATIATGDSATTNVNVMSNISYKPFEEWSNKAFLNYIYSSNDRPGERAVKINKTQLRGETAWNFTKINAAYGRMTYLNDELSSYDYILTESFGYKRRVFENAAETMNIELSAGPSFMQSKISGKDLQANEPGFQATFDYVWNFSDKSNFKQNILYNYDSKNKAIYQSISALSVKLYDHFSLQLTFQLNGTTLVVPGKENINTITSTNIMYTL